MERKIKNLAWRLTEVIGTIGFMAIPIIALLYVMNDVNNTLAEKQAQRDNATKIEQVCIVKDKQIDYGPTPEHRKIVLDISTKDKPISEYSLDMNREAYEEIEINSEVKCTLFYDDKQIIWADLSESDNL